MFGTIPVSLANVLSVLLINLMIIGGALLTFKLLWIDSYDFVFPKGNKETEEGHYSVEEVLEDESDTLVARNLSTYAKIIQKILTDLDAEYWMKYTGFDGYCFMLFQRRMIIAFLSFFVLNITLYVSMYLYLLIFEGTQLDLVKVTKMEKFEWMNIFYVCINMTFMTFIMIWTIISTRRNLQANFYYNHINSEFDNGLNFLKLRTIDIEVKRYETDVTSHKLTGVIKQELRQAGLDATVNATILMPDQSRLFELERERAELVTSFNILSKQKPYWKCVIPNELMVASEYRKKLDMLDFQIDQELMKPIKPSMTAFMSLNSLKAISHLKNKFNKDTLVSLKETLEVAKINAEEMVTKVPFWDRIVNYHTERQNTSHALLEPDSGQDLDETYVPHSEDEFKIQIRTFLNPLDVNWQHIVGERDEFVCKRVLLNLASIAVLVFLTTPTVSYCYQALLNVMADNPQDADAKNIAAKWSQKVPVVLKFFFLTMLPPLIVISVNSILILFIHLLVDWENKNRFSSYQKAIMVNCFVYFIFNMLIVPGFAATAFSNLYELLGEGIKNTGQLFRELFSLDSGDFFVILIIQQAGVSFMIQITSIVDLFTYYLSPFITLNMRVILSGKEAWRKTNKTIFEYGLAYAQQLVIAAIGIVFSGSVLIMPLAVIFYFIVRHISDAHQLLIWHRGEIESSGSLIHSATVRIVVAILISQASIFFKQLFSGTFWSICYVLAMMGFTGLFLYILDRRPLITPDKFPEDEQRLDTANLQRWWNVFSYPLAPKTNAHLSKTASILCLSKTQREDSKVWLQHIIHERSNIPKLRGDSEGDDFMKDITASNAIGAKPKGALELIAFRLQGLHQKSQKEKANP